MSEQFEQKFIIDKARETIKEKVGELYKEEIERINKEALNTGRFSYYFLTNNRERVEEEKAPDLFNPATTGKIDYIYIGGYNDSVKLDHIADQPKDYVEAFEKANQDTNKRITEAEQSGLTWGIDEFYEKMADFTVLERTNKKGVKEKFSVDFFPENMAFDLFNYRYSRPETAVYYWQNYKKKIKKSLEGFCEAALADGNIDLAKIGYKKLDLTDAEIKDIIRKNSKEDAI